MWASGNKINFSTHKSLVKLYGKKPNFDAGKAFSKITIRMRSPSSY